MDRIKKALVIGMLINLMGCTAMSPDTNPPTGNVVGTAIGAGMGAGTLAVLGVKSPLLIGAAGLAGAGLGYYLTTLRFASGGVIGIGGHVYTLGDTLIIDLPTDRLFDVNTADFLPETEPVLSSIASILKRYSDHDIFISGNTSGSWTHRFERRMSECRANQIASYLWSQGVTNVDLPYSENSTRRQMHHRRLIYVGYGDDFPIANKLHLRGIRANSRIQIVATLPYNELVSDETKRHFKRFSNVGDSAAKPAAPSADYSRYAYAFSDDHTPTATLQPDNDPRVSAPMPAMQTPAVQVQEVVGEPDDAARYNTVVGSASTTPERYNNAANAFHTETGVTAAKQRGFKGDDFKDEGALAGRSPT